MSGKLSNYINSISPAASPSLKEKLEEVEFKDEFREPELADIAWLDLAHLLQSIPVHELAEKIKEQAVEVSFSNEELAEIQRALGKNVANIERFIESDKTSEQDKSDAQEWKIHNENAHIKIKEHFKF
ncbi:MAG: hypothetical protein ACE3L7_32635 [Candidatus Pristimantibacillus sp.]